MPGNGLKLNCCGKSTKALKIVRAEDIVLRSSGKSKK
jgi:hypothetical protein